MSGAYAFTYRGLGPRPGSCRRMSGRGRSQGYGRHGWGSSSGFGPPHRRRMRRGDTRAAALVLLAEQPYNGYALMQEIENRSQGVWRPSPGSMYPALAQLEDEGLVTAEPVDGSKQFTLTDAGKAYVEENREKLGEPWAGLGDEVGEGRLALRGLLGQL